MSTRSAVRIERMDFGKAVRLMDLYRHCDGYPGESGATIVEALRATKSVESFAAHLLALDYGPRVTGDTQAHPIYELIEDSGRHGDLEHNYVVNVNSYGPTKTTITHYHREIGANKWTSTVYDLDGFVEVVNEDRREMNERLAELRAKNPGCKHYEGDDYEMM